MACISRSYEDQIAYEEAVAERDWQRFAAKAYIPAILIAFATGFIVAAIILRPIAHADVGQPPLGDLAPYTKLLQYAEQHGIPVTTAPVSCQETRWCVIGHTDYHVITLASNITPEARVCILAHELAHVALGPSETDAYFVGFRVCADLGYAPQADSQLTQLRERFPGRVSRSAIDFAAKISSVTEG